MCAKEKQALGICRSRETKQKRSRILVFSPAEMCTIQIACRYKVNRTGQHMNVVTVDTYQTCQARLVLTLSRNTMSASMNLTASFTSSCCLRCLRMASVAGGEAFRSMHTTARYAFSSSREACCCVLPSSTEKTQGVALSMQVLHRGRAPSHYSLWHPERCGIAVREGRTFDLRFRHGRHAASVCLRFGFGE